MDTPQALLPPGLQQRMSQQLYIPKLLLSLYMPSPGAVPRWTEKDSLGSHILQRRSCCQVVQKHVLSRSKHWCFPYPNLGRLWITIPAALLPGKYGSGRNQRFGRNFLPPRKSDGRRLFGQLLSPGLQHRLYRSPDTGGEISTRSQIRHPKPDCHYALQMTSWHQPWCVVQSSKENWPGVSCKWSLLVHIMLHPFCFAQNCFCPTPTIVCGKITPCSAPSSYSEASTNHSIYGSLYGRGCC